MSLARWADWGAIAVAMLAAVGLALTLLVARVDLADASRSLVIGEGEVLLAQLREELHPPPGSSALPSAPRLEAALARLSGDGLRFVAIAMGDRVVSAGRSTLDFTRVRPGDVVVEGDRALLVAPLPPPMPPPAGPSAPPPDALTALGPGDRPPPGFPGPPGFAPPPPPAGWAAPPPPGAPPLPGALGPMPVLVAEFHPAVLTRMRAGLERTATVAGAAVVVLLAFAFILTRRLARRAEDERRAEQQRRLAALGQMSSVMAHELRNPLASLKGNAQLLEEMLAAGPDASREGYREGAGSRARVKAELVVREAQRLERLTQDLLAFVRDGVLERVAVTPSELVERSLAGLDRERVAVDLTAAPAALQVDPSRVAAALGNLVRNALQAGGDGPVALHVAAAGRGGRDVLLEVRDHGPGIAPGDEENIFEPFFTTRVHGTGLGLAVARRAVEQHGGTLRASSHPQGGAVFRVLLPDAARAS